MLAEIRNFLTDVDTLTSIAPTATGPDSFAAARRSLEALDALLVTREIDAQAALNAAMLDGDPTTIAAALDRVAASASLLEQSTIPAATAAQSVLFDKMRADYVQVAESNYTTVAASFDRAATELATITEIVDITLSARDVLPLPKKAQDAWQQSVRIFLALDTTTDALIRAAKLAGAPVLSGIELVVDATGLHRRRVWEAWQDADNRWLALLKLGATIRATPYAQIATYAEPRPMETRSEWVINGGLGGERRFEVDPEDEDYDPVVASAKRGVIVHMAA
ncbi:hypothetical protein [Microbacterium sp. P02]|uniref:hypothetical protein n=1 Tax=Microbacterium sp. P02 TaxID=3366260 RepID=UPI00366CE81D